MEVVMTTGNITTGRGAGVRLRAMAGGARPGFSLLEIMLVLAIIGVLMAVVAVNVVGAGDRAKKRASEASMAVIKSALQSYNLENNSYPPDLRTLVTAKFLEDGKLKDGWGRDFLYDPRGRSKEQPFILGSAGSDQQPGNEDDLSVWTTNQANP